MAASSRAWAGWSMVLAPWAFMSWSFMSFAIVHRADPASPNAVASISVLAARGRLPSWYWDTDLYAVSRSTAPLPKGADLSDREARWYREARPVQMAGHRLLLPRAYDLDVIGPKGETPQHRIGGGSPARVRLAMRLPDGRGEIERIAAMRHRFDPGGGTRIEVHLSPLESAWNVHAGALAAARTRDEAVQVFRGRYAFMMEDRTRVHPWSRAETEEHVEGEEMSGSFLVARYARFGSDSAHIRSIRIISRAAAGRPGDTYSVKEFEARLLEVDGRFLFQECRYPTEDGSPPACEILLVRDGLVMEAFVPDDGPAGRTVREMLQVVDGMIAGDEGSDSP